VWWGLGFLVAWAVGFVVGVRVPALGFVLGGVVAAVGVALTFGGLSASAPPALKGIAARVRPSATIAGLVVACVVTSAPLGAWIGFRKAGVAAAQEQAAKDAHDAACTQARADASSAVSSIAKRSAAGVLEGCGEADLAATLRADAARQATEEEAKEKAEEAKAKEAKAKADWPAALKGVDATIAASDKLVGTGKVLDADDLLSSKQSGLGAFAGTTVTTDVDFVDAQARLEAKRKAIAPRVAPLRKAKAAAEERERKKQEAADQKAAALADNRGPMPQVSAWDGSVIAVERYLKPRLNDPDSLDMANCTMPVVDGAYWRTACAYRAKNAFGGLVLDGKVFYIQAGGLAGEGQVVKVEDLQ
jgi:hypothetical protein